MTEQTARMKKEDEKYCHECGEVIRARAEICPKCGARQPFMGGATTAPRNEKFCLECGETIAANAELCPKCGVRQPFMGMYSMDRLSGSFLGQGQPRSKIVAGLLAILGGALGLHKFYLGQPTWGIVYILFVWTGIPLILGLIEGVYFLTVSNETFDRKYAGPAWSAKPTGYGSTTKKI